MKIGIIGYGSIGRRHESMLKTHFDIKPKIVHRDDTPEQFDVAVICTPTHAHVSTMLTCIKEGCKYIFCEKPLASSKKNLDKLQKAVEENNVKVYVAYPLRHHHDIQRAVIGLRSTGELNNLPVFFECYTDAKKWPGKRRKDHVLLELSHELDLAVFCRGPLVGLEGATDRKTFSGHSVHDAVIGCRFILDMEAKEELRQVTIGDWEIGIEATDAIFIEQWKWFFANMEKIPDNAFAKARQFVEVILGFIHGSK